MNSQGSQTVDPEPELRLIAALGACWRIRSYLVEGYTWAQRLLDAGKHVAPEVRAYALFAEAIATSQELNDRCRLLIV
jgi:hypothetical protein